VYWFLVIGSLVLLGKRIVVAQAAASFFYLNNYYQAIFGDPNTGLSHTWSLGVEEQFYLLWPITFLWLKGNRARIRFLLCSIVAVWVYRELLVWVFHSPQGYIYEAFDTRADHLAIGCLVAVALRQKIWIRLWHFLVSSPWLIWVTVAGLVASAIAHYQFFHVYRDGVSFIVDPVLTAIFLVQAMAQPSAPLGKALNWGWVSYLGAISYSIYLYHPIVMHAGEKLVRKLPLLSPIVAVGSVIVVASASYWLIEQPLQRLRERFTRSTRSPEARRTVSASESLADSRVAP
jgi:peptidoglycan/LPS O-acetylase OafA/YrhL